MPTTRLGVVMDDIATLHYATDSTLALLWEAQRRNWRIDYFEQKDLSLRDGVPYGDARPLQVFEESARWFQLEEARATPLSDYQIILMRKDPPFDAAYLYTTYILDYAEKMGVKVFDNADEAIKNADVVYALRVQEERGAKAFIPSLREYSKTFGISERRLQLAKKNAILMHPGPVIRDTDVHSALVARSSQSHILEQVENGISARKALIWLLAKRYDGKVKKFKPM